MQEATLAGNELKVAEILEKIHDREIPFLTYRDENSLSCVITLCYLKARDDYDIEREDTSGKGYVDFLFTPKKKRYPPIILELKYGHSSEEAISQIKRKNYIQKVDRFSECILVGISYDKEKHHQCKIEKIVR